MGWAGLGWGRLGNWQSTLPSVLSKCSHERLVLGRRTNGVGKTCPLPQCGQHHLVAWESGTSLQPFLPERVHFSVATALECHTPGSLALGLRDLHNAMPFPRPKVFGVVQLCSLSLVLKMLASWAKSFLLVFQHKDGGQYNSSIPVTVWADSLTSSHTYPQIHPILLSQQNTNI